MLLLFFYYTPLLSSDQRYVLTEDVFSYLILRMTSASWCFGSTLLFAMVIVTPAIEASMLPSDQSAESPFTLSSSEELRHGLQRRLGEHDEGNKAMQLSDVSVRRVTETQYYRPELEGLSPVHLEMDRGDERQRLRKRMRRFPRLRYSALDRKNVSSVGETIANRKSHRSGYKAFKSHGTKALKGRGEYQTTLLVCQYTLIVLVATCLHFAGDCLKTIF